MEFRWAAATCILFFLVGFLTAPEYLSDGDTSASNLAVIDASSKLSQNDHEKDLHSMLQRQGTAHRDFQRRIRTLQQYHRPNERCDADENRRLLVKSSPSAVGANLFEKFAREFQFLSLSLQVAVATNRTLVLEDDWKLLAGLFDLPNAQTDCSEWGVRLEDGNDIPLNLKRISCLRQAVISKCEDIPGHSIDSTEPPQQRQQQTQLLRDSSSVAYGIIPGLAIDKENALFHAQYYGPELLMEMPSWPYPRSTYLIDIVPQWERSWGRFWIRSQMAHYLWEQWHATTSVVAGTTATRAPSPYLVFYWISSKQMRKNLAAKYGRNATVTQTLERYMKIADAIRRENEPTLKTIYLITDGTGDVPLPESLEEEWPAWHFVRPIPESEHGKDEKTMLTSLEVMRKASYLVGSFQSQMFRLAAELNSAWFLTQYPITKRRHWTVDVEWFENP